jgi:TrmH family RNA methyltransferase
VAIGNSCRLQIGWRDVDWPAITSRRHSLVEQCRRLAHARDGDAVLLDGAHLVAQALDAGLEIRAVLTNRRNGGLARRAAAAGANVFQATAPVLEAASPVETTTGIVAIATWRPLDVDAAFAAGSPVLGLAGVQDPGNVGSAIRSADALGAAAVVLDTHSAHPGHWRCLRGSMGSTFRIPVARAPLEAITTAARRRQLAVAATVAAGGQALDSSDLSRPLLVLLGSEGAGLAADVVAAADIRLSVPMRPGVESLNVSVAAALVLWEARRHRRQAPGR